jgi:hypothetical protein
MIEFDGELFIKDALDMFIIKDIKEIPRAVTIK